jgi:transketolase
VRPYQAGFLIFSDFQRGAIRLSALMELPVIHVYTHDSIGVGEDGPTHQPVEQIASLRAVPGLVDIRPSDANEVAEAWRWLMPRRHDPVALFLSRQPLPILDRTRYAPASGLARGAYVLADAPSGEEPTVILIASGSEVALVVDAHETLIAEGIPARVVSMPSWEIFARQDTAYQDSVLPPSIQARVAVEEASTLGWERYCPQGAIIGMSTFGASAPLKELLTKFGFTPQAVVSRAKEQIARHAPAAG